MNVGMLLLVFEFLVFSNIKLGDRADLYNHVFTFISLGCVYVCGGQRAMLGSQLGIKLESWGLTASDFIDSGIFPQPWQDAS